MECVAISLWTYIEHRLYKLCNVILFLYFRCFCFFVSLKNGALSIYFIKNQSQHLIVHKINNFIDIQIQSYLLYQIGLFYKRKIFFLFNEIFHLKINFVYLHSIKSIIEFFFHLLNVKYLFVFLYTETVHFFSLYTQISSKQKISRSLPPLNNAHIIS